MAGSIIAKRMKNLGLTVPRNSLSRVLFGSGHLSSVWGHSVHFAKFSMLRFSKGYCSNSFHPVSIKLHEYIGYHGGMHAVGFLVNAPSFNKRPMGLGALLNNQLGHGPNFPK